MKRLGISFADYNAALKKLGYPPLNNEDDLRRLFEVYLNELRPQLLDRIRRRHLAAYRRGDSLKEYLEHKSLDFIAFDSNWVVTLEELDRSFVERYVISRADLELGPDQDAGDLDEIKRLTSANQKTAQAAHPRMASLVRAWCRKNAVERPQMMDPSDAQPFVRALERSGLLDFERFLPDQLPSVCSKIDAWPGGMPQTLDPIKLSLDDADIDFEEREAREARRRSEVARRSITFGGKALDTGSTDFSQVFAELAENALSASAEWFARSRPARLELQEQPEPGRDKRKGRGGDAKGGVRRDQPPDHVLRAMGVASEYLAREYLMKRHPKEMSDRCWVSRNREAFCPDGEKGDDSLGYDFRVVTARNKMLYEVKSALDAGGEFELTARELEVAGSAAADGKRRYRLLYVPFVFDPDRWRVLTLANPAGEAIRNRYRVIRTGSVRYGFDVK